MNIKINYHKCDNCRGYYFMPCGCTVGSTWCNSCKEKQRILKAQPMPEVDLSDEKELSVIMHKELEKT